jgi:hypothetical protein
MVRLAKGAGLILPILFLVSFAIAYAQGEGELLLDDFEGVIAGGPEGTVDYGSGNGSLVEVAASDEVKYHGQQALEVSFEALSGGYIWVARGYGLDVKGAGAWLAEPKDIDFTKYNAVSFYVYGVNTGGQVAIDLVDSGSEYWRALIDDNFTGWKELVIPFGNFFARGDWQPQGADKNAELNFPIRVFQFEPLPAGKGKLYFDYLRLVKK